MPTSGIGSCAWRASRSIVRKSQSASSLPVRPSTSWTPIARLAIHRDSSSEMKAPAEPQTRQNTASAP